MACVWVWQHKQRNAGIVDVAWSVLMAMFGAYYCFYATPLAQVTGIHVLIALFMLIWYGRLGWHLWWRVRHEQEDGRYQYLRKLWQNNASAGFFGLFQVQALLAWLFTLPAWYLINVIVNQQEPLSLSGVVLAAFWLIAAGVGEHIADQQLANFKANPDNQGKTCNIGLWRYSRHPNYFFEWLQWWIWPLLGAAYGSPWVLLIAPFAMLLFLYFITGIPYTEQQALRSRGETYRRYQRTTSAFIPWFPKTDTQANSPIPD